jgi:hypothetical protein
MTLRRIANVAMNLSRTCPECQAVLVYRNLEAWQRATLRKSLCKRCAGKILPARMDNPASGEVISHNPLAGFFKLIDAQISSSSQRA